ncbi:MULTISPECIES: hypothetical protein [unclassified Campylobacter]|uniref:hypothetical protein n=1 Tax=unclassified Campylobacter TaxID=2593542 RepID=UPI0022E9CDDF|nr:MULTISPECIES: hypothetical protein [unclassified Campylobacter]MDA3042605.1 hypothetical protein [Campylobacter sp. JMF_09 ED2]MDA3044581.1 hypothetical protein [Campylobacter sp. JMF_07 ED4]MDA3063296.1 hypothetical protein [Campylobacter sp. JMF_11 EL3]MDA3071558.1 hypothetical protein [Campylobacter sp. VBCF_03 NA9]MDA3074378.1 hypothetical protein [Campylobacter sp. JMF_05 ED3]
MLEIRLFRFDPKIDVLSYFKPYIFERENFASVGELLDEIKAGDPYFSYEGVSFVKINGVVASVEEPFGGILARFGRILYIAPLSQKEARKDLECGFESFYSKFQSFSAIANSDTFEFYKELAPYFYSSNLRKFSEVFLGNSAFVFANFLLENFPQKRGEILDFIRPQLVYFTPCNALNLDYDCDLIYDRLCELCGIDPARADKIYSAQSLAEIDANTALHRYTGFKIAVWGDEGARDLVRRFGGDVVRFERENEALRAEIYGAEKECALRVAGEILFDAFDSGADFLLVNSKKALGFIDGKSAEICALMGRELIDFYLLSTDEFITLSKGEKPKTLASHKLKVALV